MPTKSKTNRKTRNNRKTRKMKGGYWCIFENRENTDCSNNPIDGIEMSPLYYYFLHKDNSGELTLFAYRPHVFKHFDDFFQKLIPLDTITNKQFNDYIIFKKKPNERPENLQEFIDKLNRFFTYWDLSYSKLLKTRYFKPRYPTDNNTSIIVIKGKNEDLFYEILWQKKRKPKKQSEQFEDKLTEYNIDYNKVNTCIQIVSIRKIKKNTNYPNNYILQSLYELKILNSKKKAMNYETQYSHWFDYTDDYSTPKNAKINTNTSNIIANELGDDKDVFIPNNKQLMIHTMRSLDRLTISRKRRLQEQEKLEQEKLEQEKLEQEKLEQEKLEQEKLEQERLNNSNLNYNAADFVPQTPNNSNLNYNAADSVPQTPNNSKLNYNAKVFVPGTTNKP
jgi:hypothetical protein